MSDKVPFRPLGANILGVKRQGAEKVGRLFVPEGAKEKLYEAEVVAVGPGHRKDDGSREEMDVKVGDIVMYGKYTGHDVRIDGRDYIVMTEADILGIVGGDAPEVCGRRAPYATVFCEEPAGHLGYHRGGSTEWARE